MCDTRADGFAREAVRRAAVEAVEAVAMHCGLVGLLPGLCATLDTTRAPRTVCATLRAFCGLAEAAGIDDDVTDHSSFR